MSDPFADFLDEVRLGLLSLFGPWSEHVEQIDRVLDGPISLVRARTMNGSIVVRSNDQHGVMVRAWVVVRGPTEGLAEAFAERVFVSIEQRKETLIVHAAYPAPPLGTKVFVRYDILVPRSVDLDLYTHNGGIDVADVEGAIEAETWNGNIELENTLGPATLYTSNGGIHLSGVDGAVDAESGNGPIDLQDTGGRVRLGTTGGRITVKGPEGSVRARSRGGDIDVLLPPTFDGYLDARTVQGVVVCELPACKLQRTNRLLAGTPDAGADTVVQVQTFDGDIRIRALEA